MALGSSFGVPTEFASFDNRVIVRHSTKIRISEDRHGRRASGVAEKLNRELEAYWRAMVGGPSGDQMSPYELARQQVRALGFELLEMPQLIALPAERTAERLEALAANRSRRRSLRASAVIAANTVAASIGPPMRSRAPGRCCRSSSNAV